MDVINGGDQKNKKKETQVRRTKFLDPWDNVKG